MRDYLKLTRAELYERIWSIPARKLSEELGISDVMIGKLCKKHGVPKPPPGYWARVHAGQKVRRPPLPAPQKDQSEEIYIRQLTESEFPKRQKKKRPIDSQTIPKIVVPEELSHPHPLVKATRAGLKEASLNTYGLLEPLRNYQGLDVRVSPDLLPRALRIMQALILALEDQGHSIKVVNQPRKRNTSVLIEGEAIRFWLGEGVRKVKRPIAPKDFWERSHDYFPLGQLKFAFGNSWSPKKRLEWADSAKAPLEDKLHLVVAGMREQAVLEKQAQLEREEWHRKYQEERQRQEAIARRKREEERRLEVLQTRARQWHQTYQLRAFLRACENAWEPGAVGNREHWLAWAYQQADQLDPLKNGQALELIAQLSLDEA